MEKRFFLSLFQALHSVELVFSACRSSEKLESFEASNREEAEKVKLLRFAQVRLVF